MGWESSDNLKTCLTILLALICVATYAQTDSISFSPPDSIVNRVQLRKLDSLQQGFTKNSDSIKQSYITKKEKLTSLKQRYLLKIDSLKARKSAILGNPLDTLNTLNTIDPKSHIARYTHKADSVDRQIENVQRHATHRIDSLKGKVNDQLEKLKLPKEAQGKVAGLTSVMDKVNVPSFDSDVTGKLGLNNNSITSGFPAIPSTGNFPTTTFPSANLPNTNLPSVNPDIPGLDVKAPALDDVRDKIPSTDINTGKVGEITGQAGDVQQQIKEATGSMEGLGNTLENKAGEQVKGLPDQKLPEIPGMPGGVPNSGDAAKEQLMDLAKKEAVNHLAGREAVLTAAMQKMSKYKQKYSSVNSLADIKDEKWHNEMKGKPLRERLVPALTLQFQSWQDLMLDINPSVGYKLTTHLTAGLGWNQRVAFNILQSQFNEEAKVYGIRSYAEYTFNKGFGFRLDIETMNTPAKQKDPAVDIPPSRDWIWGTLIGIKQKYPIYKKLKGNAQLMYNIFDKDHRSPYIERINFRIGLELTLKKRKSNSSK